MSDIHTPMSIPEAREVLIDCAKRHLTFVRSLVKKFSSEDDRQYDNLKAELELLSEALGVIGQLDQNVTAEQLPIGDIFPPLPTDPKVLEPTVSIVIATMKVYGSDMRRWADAVAQVPQITAQEAVLRWADHCDEHIIKKLEGVQLALRNQKPIQ